MSPQRRLKRPPPPTPADEARALALAEFAHTLGYETPTPTLISALTHRSYVNELHPAQRAAQPDNQRLEFLGDAVVGLVVAQRLMTLEPSASEGALSAKRARLINAHTLARCAERLGVEPHLRCGRGEPKMGPHARDARLADSFEALAGALFEDLGFERADAWVWSALLPIYETIAESASPKNRLQELTLSLYKTTPRYEPLQGQTSPTGEPLVGVAVWLGGERLAERYDLRRKAAEEAAALDALATLERRLSAAQMTHLRGR